MKPLATRPLATPALAAVPASTGTAPAATNADVTIAPRFVLKAPAPEAAPAPTASPAAPAADAEAAAPVAALPAQDPAQLLACLAQMSGQVQPARPAGADASGKPAAAPRAVPDLAQMAKPGPLPAMPADALPASALAEALPPIALPRIATAVAAPASATPAATPLPAAADQAAPRPASPASNAASGFTPVLAGLGLGIDTAALFSNPRSAAPAPLQLAPSAPDSWQQPLLQALGDRLQLQIAARNGDQAVLHLAPPQLGRVEIEIRQQGGVLQVQMSASHDEVGRQLRQISEPLRQELVQRHTGEVSVQVSASSSAGPEGRGREAAAGQSQPDPREQAERRAPARARDEDEQAASGFAQRMARTAAALNG